MTTHRRPLVLGDRVFVRGWPPVSLEVVDADSDPSLVTLMSPNGTRLRVGRRMIVRTTNSDRRQDEHRAR